MQDLSSVFFLKTYPKSCSHYLLSQIETINLTTNIIFAKIIQHNWRLMYSTNAIISAIWAYATYYLVSVSLTHSVKQREVSKNTIIKTWLEISDMFWLTRSKGLKSEKQISCAIEIQLRAVS